ncbi:MAG TPA: CGNR zinc finger domain-containing protein [Streptosporangiaceae bacterium]|nr:CGNR zinc finger domain-containing protein [Streptosporangiaceae bacterium]
MTSQTALLGGSVHDAAQRAADILAVLLPRAGNRLEPGSPGERDAVIEVLEAHGEPSPVEISPADLEGLRRAALELREVFTAGDVATAADRINGLLAGRAHPPRLTTHGGASGWHLHVDSSDDAPSGEWLLTSSALALAVLLAERQAPPAGICASPTCGRPFVNVGRGSPRRYCSAACGTRERVAAHRQVNRGAVMKG